MSPRVKVLVCQLPEGSILSPEKTGFGSLPRNLRYYPEIVIDPFLIKMVESYNKLLRNVSSSEREYLIMNRQNYFTEVIQSKYQKADCSDVDFLKVIVIPTGYSFKVTQGRSGYEEVIIWSFSHNPSIYIPGRG